jgi:hypothetical protein
LKKRTLIAVTVAGALGVGVGAIFGLKLAARLFFEAAFPLTNFPPQAEADALADLVTLSSFRPPAGSKLLSSAHSLAWDGTDSRVWVFQLHRDSEVALNLPGSLAQNALDMTHSEAHWQVGVRDLEASGVTSKQFGTPESCWHFDASLPDQLGQQTSVNVLKSSGGVWILVNRLVVK